MIIARFAPSPTGNLHLGSLYIAFFNYLLSSNMLLRIEDTDTKRSSKAYENNILSNLELMNIQYDKIVRQSDNISTHLEIANYLLRNKYAYKCKGEENDHIWINKQNYFAKNVYEPYVIRLNVNRIIEDEIVTFYDEVYGQITYPTKDLDDLIIVRSNKQPTYNLSAVVDDINGGITHIIRGNDHMTNTFKQVLIYKALGKTIPKFVHLPLIESMSGGKLSKRRDAISVDMFLRHGFLPIAILNILYLLGISSEKEILTLDEMKANVDINKISKSSAKFDIDKLRYINAQHIRSLSASALKESMINFVQFTGLNLLVLNIFSRREVMDQFIKRSNTLKDLYDFMAVYYDRSDRLNIDLLRGYDTNLLKDLISLILEKKEFVSKELMDEMKVFAKKNDMRPIQVLMPLRILITNRLEFPNFFDVLEYWNVDVARHVLTSRLKQLDKGV